MTVFESGSYRQIAQAIAYLHQQREQQPGLTELARHIGLSESHLQRLFSQWAGVSPKQYLQFITKEHAKRCLEHETVLQAALSSGLSGSGRLYDLMISYEAMTPGEYKRSGQGVNICYGIHPSPFGDCLIAITEKGICKLAFIDNQQDHYHAERELKAQWPLAHIEQNMEVTGAIAQRIFSPVPNKPAAPLKVLFRGSPFQIKVWEALLHIPEGKLCSYQNISTMINKPTAVRAVASAIGQNNIGYLIPCHRVIRKNGDFSQYRWGAVRKQAIVGWEQGRCKNRLD